MSKKIAPDAAVRARVLRTDESFIVQAPAGSGKTELLTQRFLALLAEVDEPESVLAITFTRKAASEMRGRILDALEEAAAALRAGAPPLEDPHKQQRRELAMQVLKRDADRNWRLLENPSRLEVRTVDSLCDSIARRMPVLAGVASDLQPSEDASELYREAADRLIAEVANEHNALLADAIAVLLTRADNNVGRLRELIVSILGKRDQWMRILARSDMRSDHELQDVRANLERAMASAIEDDLRSARETISSELGEVSEMMAYVRHAADNRDDINELRDLRELPAATVADLPAWGKLLELILTSDSKSFRVSYNAKNGFTDKDVARGCKELFEQLKLADNAKLLCGLLKRIRCLPSHRYTDDEWQFVRALLVALPHAAAHLKVAFAERGKVDFIEMAQAATVAMQTAEGPTELGLAVGARIEHILVDEFQDTSKSQLEFLRALLAGWEQGAANSIFVVGDPMQSIYAFREAEVTIFIREFESRRGRSARQIDWPLVPQRLTANFRSNAALVEWFNRTHSQILSRTDEATGAVEYARADAVKDAEANAIQVRGFAPKDRQSEAAYIAEAIEAALAADAKQSIAVLVRARSHLGAIVEQLQQRRIAYRAVKIDALSEQPVVRDLNSLARAILDAADRTAWLAVLRAPWCGLPLADLWELCRGDKHSSVLDLLRERISRLKDRKRAERVLPILEAAVANRARVPLHMLIERTWIQLGGPAACDAESREQQVRDAEVYRDLVQQCEAEAIRPGSDAFNKKLDELYAPPSTDPNIRVELMTIHGAKGLEWDVVFVPGLNRKPSSDDTQLLYWRERLRDGRDELLLAPMRSAGTDKHVADMQAFLKRLADDRAMEESKRLLYVATTRAKRQLHLTATLPEPEKEPEAHSLLALLWKVDHVREAFLQSAAPALPNEEPGPRVPRPLRRLPDTYVMPAAPSPLMRLTESDFDEPLHTFDWVSETRRHVGTVTHAFLQRIAREGLSRWNSDALARSRTSIRTALASQGVGPDELSEAVEQVARALASTISDERGRWILDAHAEAACELGITLDGAAHPVRIDRTFVEDDVRWIVDFKITAIQGGSTEQYFDAQVDKYREDLARYVEALRPNESRPIRCALYFPLQQVWREVEIAASASAQD